MRANDAFGAVAALAASQHGAVNRRQAADVGVDKHAIHRLKRDRLLDEPLPGALVLAGTPPTWRRELMVLTLAGRERAVVSCRATAALHRLEGCVPCTPEVHIPAWTTLEAPGSIVHRVKDLDEQDIFVVDGIRCTGLARTLTDLGDAVGLGELQRAFDDADRRGVSRRWLRETALRLHRSGCAGPRALLGLVDAAEREPQMPESWFERVLENALRHPDLPPIVRQHVLRRADGSFVARLDLAMPSIKLGIEAHSRRFHFDAASRRADEDRDLAAAAEGWHLLYLGWQDARRPETAVRLLRDVAARRLAP